MSKVPSLVSGCNGRPEPYKTSRQTTCTRCQTRIAKDSMVAKILTKKGAYLSKPIFCIGCVEAIIRQTRNDLCELEKSLQPSTV